MIDQSYPESKPHRTDCIKVCAPIKAFKWFVMYKHHGFDSESVSLSPRAMIRTSMSRLVHPHDKLHEAFDHFLLISLIESQQIPAKRSTQHLFC